MVFIWRPSLGSPFRNTFSPNAFSPHSVVSSTSGASVQPTMQAQMQNKTVRGMRAAAPVR